MSKITLTIDSEDVATLREVFHLALIQSEVTLADADEASDVMPTAYTDAAYETHRAVLSLTARIDAMLPDSTGFFD